MKSGHVVLLVADYDSRIYLFFFISVGAYGGKRTLKEILTCILECVDDRHGLADCPLTSQSAFVVHLAIGLAVLLAVQLLICLAIHPALLPQCDTGLQICLRRKRM